MYSFLVLGQIPGTNIQISFEIWLLSLGLLLLGSLAYRRLHQPANELSETITHNRIHASQLHFRIS
jgi:hypothetical protein